MSFNADIAIRLAEPHDAPALVAVEASAGALFRSIPDLAWVADEALAAPESFLPLIAAGTVWVAKDGGAVLGELRAEVWDDALHILELAVASTHQQRGLGRRLLDAAGQEARKRHLRGLTLTTFRHVAWNAPFYARYGFVELSDAACTPRLRDIIRAEEARGLPNRCAMRLSF